MEHAYWTLEEVLGTGSHVRWPGGASLPAQAVQVTQFVPGCERPTLPFFFLFDRRAHTRPVLVAIRGQEGIFSPSANWL